jgi:hypothetical protein
MCDQCWTCSCGYLGGGDENVCPDCGAHSRRFKRDFATAWECADGCDTCWFLITDTALEELGDPVIAVKLRNHLASGHRLNSEEAL